jgi:protocatechuate 3,4-dioxygenase beta subunit
MPHFPEPDQTPDGPAYEGRLLPHADEEVVDQGVRFDLTTLMSRRGLLGLGVLGLGAVTLAACAPTGTTTSTASPTGSATTTPTSGTSSTEIPEETAGPYPGDGSNGPDVLEMSGIERRDIRSSIGGGATADGVPLTVTFELRDLVNGGVPFAGVAVYAWHCDAQGRYSMYSAGVENETYLRGVQVADSDGRVTFTSIVPGCYSGRWPHIHFEVYPDLASITDSTAAIATSQLAFPKDVCEAVYADSRYPGSSSNLASIGSLTNDNIFGDDGGELQLATVTGSVSGGYTATLTVNIDTSTAAGGGAAAPGSR